MTWLAVALAGALGAASRYLLDHAVSTRVAGVLPWGTLLVNVSGSFAAGVLAGLAVEATLPADVHVVLAGGFLGAYTTFSTAMYETARLVEDGATAAAITNLLLPLVSSVAAASLGWALVS